MPEFCNCGAELPPDARFCHKCGKPQGQDAVGQSPDEAPIPEIHSQSGKIPLGLDFHNPVAVRVGLSAASLASLLSWLPFLNLGFVIWWAAAGFFSVYLYHRRTGQLLTVRNGLRMGWITGILTFAIMIVLFTISIVPAAVSRGGLSVIYQEQLRSMPMHDPNMEQALRIFETPAGLATVLLLTLLMVFTIIIFLCTAGGALGAKVVGRD